MDPFGDEHKRDGAKLMAQMAAMLIVASAILFSVSMTVISDNNAIGLENAKFEYLYNISLQDYSELNTQVVLNNQIGMRFGILAWVSIMLAVFFVLIAIYLWIKTRPKIFDRYISNKK